jgi:hypothetical protein
MFAYARAAIDFWPGWLSEEEFKAQLAHRCFTQRDIANAWSRYEQFRDRAYDLAKKVGWEGDIRSGPFIAGLPTHETAIDGNVMLAWKQDNNGDTFVVSPYKLPWLEGGDYGKWTAAG